MNYERNFWDHEIDRFKALAYGQGVEGRECLKAGYLLFYGTSGVGRWVSFLSESKCFLLIFVLF